MSKIIKVEIDWMDKWANAPQFVVTLDAPIDRDKLVYDSLKVGRMGGTAYKAVLGDYADFMWHDPTNERGYGGRVMPLRLKDGRTVEVKGPWSSNSSDMNKLFGRPLVTEVTINTPNGLMAGAVLVEPLYKACREAGIEIVLVHTYCGDYWQPLRDGKPKDARDTIITKEV